MTSSYPFDENEILKALRLALVDECGVDGAAVTPSVHLLDDLAIDSLDLINASYRIEQDCGLKLPFRDWLAVEYGNETVVRSPFIVSEICAYIGAHAPTSGHTK